MLHACPWERLHYACTPLMGCFDMRTLGMHAGLKIVCHASQLPWLNQMQHCFLLFVLLHKSSSVALQTHISGNLLMNSDCITYISWSKHPAKSR